MMAIVRNPTAVTLGQLYTSFNRAPDIAIGLAAGNTEPPAGYTLPSYVIQTLQNTAVTGANIRSAYYARRGVGPPPVTAPPKGPAFTARIAQGVAASEGNNRALYLTTGIYETNYTMSVSDYQEMAKEEAYQGVNIAAGLVTPWKNKNQPRVYLVMPANIAELNRQAEKEHCDDFIQAYNLTLGAAQAIITQLNGQTFGPAGSALLANQLAEQALLARVPQALQSLGVDMAKWGQKYLSLCEKSKLRDVSSWHSWGLELIDESALPQMAVTYLTGGPREESGRIYLRFTTGATKIGQHTSAAVVTY